MSSKISTNESNSEGDESDLELKEGLVTESLVLLKTGGKEIINKKKRRLEKNRESARQSRKRKKERIMVLEERLQHLEQQAVSLKLQLNMGKEAIEKEEAEKRKITGEFQGLINEHASEEVLKKVINQYRDKFADYGSNRQKQLEYHLSQIQRLILPTQITKMCINSLHHVSNDNEEKKEEKKDEIGGDLNGLTIWNMLVNEIGLSMGQQLQFLTRRNNLKDIWKDLQEFFVLTAEARASFLAKNARMESEMNILQNNLSPEQQAKLILWMSNNPAFMQMLDKLFKVTVHNDDI